MFSRSFLRLVTVVCVILLLESGFKRPKNHDRKIIFPQKYGRWKNDVHFSLILYVYCSIKVDGYLIYNLQKKS